MLDGCIYLQRISLSSLWDVPFQRHGGGQFHCTGCDVEVSCSSAHAERFPHPKSPIALPFVHKHGTWHCTPAAHQLRLAVWVRFRCVFSGDGCPDATSSDTGQVLV